MAFSTTVIGAVVAVLPPRSWDMIGDDGNKRTGVTRKAIVSLDFSEEPVTLKFSEDRVQLYDEVAGLSFGDVIEARGDVKGEGIRQALYVTSLRVGAGAS